ncbi:MAG: tripartite tricarboxylate transporter TctB family protein [Thermodesulfobacteriota bacterium]
MDEIKTDPGLQTWKDKINFNTVAAICLTVFSIAAFLLIPYQIEEPKLFMGRSLMYMTPSLFPRLSIIGLFILSIWYLTHSFEIKEKNLFREIGKNGYIRVLVTFGVTVGYALLFEPLGFVLSSALMVAILTIYYGNRNIFIIVLVLAGAPLGIYFIFTHVLKVSLPEGLLF